MGKNAIFGLRYKKTVHEALIHLLMRPNGKYDDKCVTITLFENDSQIKTGGYCSCAFHRTSERMIMQRRIQGMMTEKIDGICHCNFLMFLQLFHLLHKPFLIMNVHSIDYCAIFLR